MAAEEPNFNNLLAEIDSILERLGPRSTIEAVYIGGQVGDLRIDRSKVDAPSGTRVTLLKTGDGSQIKSITLNENVIRIRDSKDPHDAAELIRAALKEKAPDRSVVKQAAQALVLLAPWVAPLIPQILHWVGL